jgi:hypothetical protein
VQGQADSNATFQPNHCFFGGLIKQEELWITELFDELKKTKTSV